MRLPFFSVAALGSRWRMSSLESAATRLRRQMATGSCSTPSAPASRLARPVAGAPQHAGKHIGMPVDHVGVGVTPRRDQPDIFRHGRVRRTCPLAVHDLVKVIRILGVGRRHPYMARRPGRRCAPFSRCRTHCSVFSPGNVHFQPPTTAPVPSGRAFIAVRAERFPLFLINFLPECRGVVAEGKSASTSKLLNGQDIISRKKLWISV